jgi:signal peptide peptidase SppA
MTMLSLIHQIAGRPWAIRGEIAANVHALVARRQEVTRGTLTFGTLREFARLKGGVHAFDEDGREDRRMARGSRGAVVGTIAVIPIIGTLTQRGDEIDSAFTRSTDEIAAEVTAAAAEPKVNAIVLELDSPGGEVFGVPEAWQAIREARKLKPVVAAVNSVAASAGYYMASAADEIVVTPSGEVGSIGVYMLHIDASKYLEELGEKWSFVSAGKYKVEGNPTEPLGDEARGAYQAVVDRYFGMFTRDVARGRRRAEKTVRDGFGQGRMVGAADAVEQGMADQVGTLDAAIRRAAQLGRERREQGSTRTEHMGLPVAGGHLFPSSYAEEITAAMEKDEAERAAADNQPSAEQAAALGRLRL